MSPAMSREERDAIRARAEAAMPGPWEYEPSTDEILSPDGGIAEMTWPGRTRTSAEFIAHARTDVTALLDALDEAERRIALAHEVGNEIGERCARAEAEVERWRNTAEFAKREADTLREQHSVCPTTWAFEQACRAIEKHRTTSDAARAERDFEERRADGLAAELAALRKRIEGLADEIAKWHDREHDRAFTDQAGPEVRDALRRVHDRIRALLATPTDPKEA